MKNFKNFLVALGCFFVITSVWISSILWVPKLTMYLERNVACAETLKSAPEQTKDAGGEPACIDSLSKVGATGDIFGAINSLFTGLALFAVAVTLWVDGKARRQALKPLVISVANKDFFIVDDPQIHPETSLKFTITPIVSNIVNEPAVNVSINITLIAKLSKYALATKFYETPLVEGTTLPIEIEEVIKGGFLFEFLGCLTESQGRIEIFIETKYENLEQIRWATEVRYYLELHNTSDTAKFNAVREKNPGTQGIWGNSAVALKSDVVTGSWKRRLV